MTAIIQLVDNLDYAADGTETPAAHKIRFAVQVDDGDVESFELDLTEEHTQVYLTTLRKLGEHANPGTSGGTIPARRAVTAPRKPKKSKASPVRGEGLSASKQYRRAQREWIEKYGISRLDASGLPANRTPAGGDYWPEWLNESYEHFLKTGDVIVPLSEESFLKARGSVAGWKKYMFQWTPLREPNHRIPDGGDGPASPERRRP